MLLYELIKSNIIETLASTSSLVNLTRDITVLGLMLDKVTTNSFNSQFVQFINIIGLFHAIPLINIKINCQGLLIV